MAVSQLVPIDEAAAELGVTVSALRMREKAKHITLIRQKTAGRGANTFVSRSELERAKANPPARANAPKKRQRGGRGRGPSRPRMAAKADPSTNGHGSPEADPVLIIIDRVQGDLKLLRKALADHDKQVRRDSIDDLARSLQEAAARA